MILWTDFFKSCSDFRKNFLDFKLDAVVKQGILTLNSYSSKSYAFVIFSYSKLAFLGEDEDETICSFLYNVF